MMSPKSKINSSITNLKESFSSDIIIGSVIQKTIVAKSISMEKVIGSSEIEKYLPSANSRCIDLLPDIPDDETLKHLERIFENLIDVDRKKSEGVVYTPDYIIDYIIRYSMDLWEGKGIPTICDPACGSGGFLIRALDYLLKYKKLSAETAIQKYIFGVDINEEAVSCAKIQVELYCLLRNESPPNLDKSIIVGDTLLGWKSIVNQIPNLNDGVDLLITNPPYVKLQSIETDYREKLERKYSGFTTGSYSTAMLFLIAGLEILSKSGILGYITQNNLYTSLAAKNVRAHLQQRKSLHTIIDFSHNKVFKNVQAYTCLMFLTKSNNANLLFKQVDAPELNLKKQTIDQFTSLPLAKLNSRKWRLAEGKHTDYLHIIENKGVQLADLATIRVGFATLKDAVFIIDPKSDEYSIEEEICKPAIKVADITGDNFPSDHIKRVIFPYVKENSKWKLIPEAVIKSRYPNCYSYLLAHKSSLKSRPKKMADNEYHQWGRIQSMEAPGPKLLTKTFSKGPRFMLDSGDSLFCNGYSVKPKVGSDLFSSTIDIELLQALLNSIVMDYYAKLTTFQIEGQYQCFQKNFIEMFSIPEAALSAREEILSLSGEERDRIVTGIYGLPYDELVDITSK